MSTSLLYHAFGMVDYEYRKTEYHGGKIHFYLKPKYRAIRCPKCRHWNVTLKGTVERTFITIPVGWKPVHLVVSVPRVFCALCNIVCQIKLSFAAPKKRHTKKFERYVLELSKFMTIKDVSKHLGVSWDVVKDIQKRNLEKKFRKPKLKKIKHIAIDEISVGKGNKFITLVLNEKLTAFRRKLYHGLSDPLEKELLKGTRWLLLKNPDNLNSERNEHERLEKALEINKPLATAYYMKEDLRQIWTQANKEQADQCLWDWAGRAIASEIPTCLAADRCWKSLHTPCSDIDSGSWPTMITPSPQAHWKEPTIKSKL